MILVSGSSFPHAVLHLRLKSLSKGGFRGRRPPSTSKEDHDYADRAAHFNDQSHSEAWLVHDQGLTVRTGCLHSLEGAAVSFQHARPDGSVY